MEPSARVDEKLQAVLDKLDGVRSVGGRHRAYCPVHEPAGKQARAKSLRDLQVREGDIGIVVHCHAGCDYRDVLKALGFEWKDLLYDAGGKRRPRKLDPRGTELEMPYAVERLQNEPDVLRSLLDARGWPAGVFRALGVGWDGERLNMLVRDESGKPHDVLRYSPFGRPKMLAGKGRTRLPWPSPETVSSMGRSRWLYVVEGEGTVFSLAALNLPAVALPGSVSAPTSNPHRPSSFTGTGWRTHWARRFRGRSLALFPDGNDVGRALMRAAEYDLAKENCVVTTCDLGFADGEDVGDWLEPVRTGRDRRLARGLLQGFVATCRLQPERVDEMRELLHGFSGSLSGEGNASTTGYSPRVERPANPSPDSAPWNWAAA